MSQEPTTPTTRGRKTRQDLENPGALVDPNDYVPEIDIAPGKPDNNQITPEQALKGEFSVPGLNGFNTELAASRIDKFDITDFDVKNPLKPPKSLPQVTDGDFAIYSKRYKRATNAVRLHRANFQLQGEVYQAVNDKYKAIQHGISAEKTKEIVKGDYLDLLSQREKTKQGAIAFDLAVFNTNHQAQMSGINKEQLVANRTKAELVLSKTQFEIEKLQTEEENLREEWKNFLPKTN